MSVRDKLTRLYEESADPWGFETSAYERRKYALTLAALPRERYTLGVRARLLDRCPDGAARRALRHAARERPDPARGRVGPRPRRRDSVTCAWSSSTPRRSGPRALRSDRALRARLLPPAWRGRRVGRRVGASASEGATIVAVHWRGAIDDWALPAEQAHDVIRHEGTLTTFAQYVEESFLLEVFER